VKEKGLQDQLLGIVVRMEEPKLENDKADLVRTVAAAQRKLVELEDSVSYTAWLNDTKRTVLRRDQSCRVASHNSDPLCASVFLSFSPSQILTLLKTAGGENNANYSLVEDLDLINALQLSKSTSEEVKVKLLAAQQTEERIDAAREGYRSCAVRASMCFFVINDLALVDPMYQFSLKAYVELFKHSIAASRDDKGLQQTELLDRCANLNEFHTEAVYKYTCRALFEKHKLIFAFNLTAQKLRGEDKLDASEWDFLLKGGQVLDRSSRAANPCPDWLSEAAWDNVTELDKLALFKNIAHSFEAYVGNGTRTRAHGHGHGHGHGHRFGLVLGLAQPWALLLL
jgi:dynein heavy chain